MSFLKKHYEKIILTFLLIVFVAVLVLQIGILLQGKSVTSDDLKIPKKAPDYTRVNPKDVKYDVTGLLVGSDSQWASGKSRSPEASPIFTDLCVPISLAKCPYCERMVPIGDFPPAGSEKIGHCSYCGANLPARPKPVVEIHDLDKDGIPDEVEDANGLNKNDPSDAQKDMDGDGFTNLEEYLNGTDMKDPKSRPSSYAKKLYVVEIMKRDLNMVLTKVGARGEDRSKWEIHMDVVENGRKRTRFYNIGSVIKSDDGEFKILDILIDSRNEAKPEEEGRPKVIIQKIGSEDKLVAEIGRRIAEPREKITLLYGVTNKQITLYQGDSITLGDESSGLEKFIAVSSNPSARTVQLKREDGQIFEIKPLEAPGGAPNEMRPDSGESR